jgi:hypothetical protein
MIHNLSDKEALEVIKGGKASWDISEPSQSCSILEETEKKLARLQALGFIEYTSAYVNLPREGRKLGKVVVTLIKTTE